MKYLVFDFETNGVGVDKNDGYRPYPADRTPLPRANYPMQIAAARLDARGDVEASWSALVLGVERVDPWVARNCPHLDVASCRDQGVGFEDVLAGLSRLAAEAEDRCALVAHNIAYDWDEVIVRTVEELGLWRAPAYTHLQALPRMCTCVNAETKRQGKAYYYAKIGKWIGPKLGDLAASCRVPFDERRAHDARYDVDVTAACLRHSLQRTSAPPSSSPCSV